MSYCDFCVTRPATDVHKVYHDFHYGFPIESDDELFGRLILEINQAGLSWQTILNKQRNFEEAFDGFQISLIAHYDSTKIESLLQNVGIIRNKLKVNAVIYNAQQILTLQNEFGSFKNWLDQQVENSKEKWVNVFKKRFKFVGGEIVNEFLMSTGYLPGAHQENCPIFDEIKKHNPSWIIQHHKKVNELK